MKQEGSSALDLLREAVEAAVGARSGRSGLSLPALGVLESGVEAEQALPQTASGLVSSVAGGLTALRGGTKSAPVWQEWVSRVNPIAGLLAGLFAGRSETASEAAPTEYERPGSMWLDAGFGGTDQPAISMVERQEGGQFRPTGGGATGAQVVVQVQAMDSRSFLDHTPEIAQAVKRALLESNGLGDVMGEY